MGVSFTYFSKSDLLNKADVFHGQPSYLINHSEKGYEEPENYP
jgi:hypothetical protein